MLRRLSMMALAADAALDAPAEGRRGQRPRDDGRGGGQPGVRLAASPQEPREWRAESCLPHFKVEGLAVAHQRQDRVMRRNQRDLLLRHQQVERTAAVDAGVFDLVDQHNR